MKNEVKVLVAQSCLTLWALYNALDSVAHQTPLSMEFSRQEYWSGLPFSSPGDLPDPGIEYGSPALQVDSLPSEPPENACMLKCNYFGYTVVVQSNSCVQLFVTRKTVACQAPLSMGFPRQEYQSGLPFSSPGDLPNPGIKLMSPASPALVGGFLTTEPPGKLPEGANRLLNPSGL